MPGPSLSRPGLCESEHEPLIVLVDGTRFLAIAWVDELWVAMLGPPWGFEEVILWICWWEVGGCLWETRERG